MVSPLSSISSSDSLFNLQSSALTSKVSGVGVRNSDNGAYYAKKGEPMYVEEMDSDDDGVISFDEFKNYCNENDISPKEMVTMVEMANSYRTMQADSNTSQKIQKQNNENITNSVQSDKNISSDAVYAEKGDSKYNEEMDSNSDDKITYQEYLDYCKEHAKINEHKSDTRIQQSSDGVFRTLNYGKALNTYTQAESVPSKSVYEKIA